MKWSNSSRNAKNFFLNFFFYFDGLPQVINQIFHFQPIDIGSHMRNLAFKWGFCFCLDPRYSTFPRSFSRPTEQVNCTLSISALKYLLLYLLKYMCIFWNMFMHADLMVGCLPAWQRGGGSCPPGFHCVFGYCKPGMKPDGNLGYDYQVIFNQFVQLKQAWRVVFPPTRNASCFIVALVLIINRYFESTMKPDLNDLLI